MVSTFHFIFISNFVLSFSIRYRTLTSFLGKLKSMRIHIWCTEYKSWHLKRKSARSSNNIRWISLTCAQHCWREGSPNHAGPEPRLYNMYYMLKAGTQQKEKERKIRSQLFHNDAYSDPDPDPLYHNYKVIFNLTEKTEQPRRRCPWVGNRANLPYPSGPSWHSNH